MSLRFCGRLEPYFLGGIALEPNITNQAAPEERGNQQAAPLDQSNEQAARHPPMFTCPRPLSIPYPRVQVNGRNAEYARMMLSNMASDNSEMNAIAQYFYNQLITEERFGAISHCFRQIGETEMHHLEIFGQLALMLGADPRLWSYRQERKTYWTPGYIQYPREIHALIQNSIDGENAAIRKYSEQARIIRDQHIVALLNRIILDERQHIEIFNQMLESV